MDEDDQLRHARHQRLTERASTHVRLLSLRRNTFLKVKSGTYGEVCLRIEPTSNRVGRLPKETISRGRR